MIVVCFILFYLLVMFLLSKNYIPAETLVLQRPFLQLTLLAQQIRSSRPPLGREVQEASTTVMNSLARSVPVGGKFSGKLNFGVSTRGGVG